MERERELVQKLREVFEKVFSQRVRSKEGEDYYLVSPSPSSGLRGLSFLVEAEVIDIARESFVNTLGTIPIFVKGKMILFEDEFTEEGYELLDGIVVGVEGEGEQQEKDFNARRVLFSWYEEEEEGKRGYDALMLVSTPALTLSLNNSKNLRNLPAPDGIPLDDEGLLRIESVYVSKPSRREVREES